MRKTRQITLILLLVIFYGMLTGCGGAANCDGRENVSQKELLNCVAGEGAREHLEALQKIAEANDGNRAAGTPGYDASVAYVVDTLKAAGYDVELQEFDFIFEGPQHLQQTAPDDVVYETGKVTGTGFGRVAGPVVPVDLALGQEPWPADPATATSGCELSDFEGLDFSGSNDIAMVEGGGCLSSTKALNAQDRGAEAVIILLKEETSLEPGETVDRVNLLLDGSPSNVTIPVVAVGLSKGVPLSQEGSEAFLEVPEKVQTVQTNVLAELPGSEVGRVVMAGAHLDSVLAGPGMNDNGSGSAAILETAVQMAGVKPRNTVRFAWWGAEEAGLIGSSTYVESLSEMALAEIALYLNFDMIASPNPGTFIFDGDGSDSSGAGKPSGVSAKIEDLLASFYADRDSPVESTGMIGSDDVPFRTAGIPTGYVFTGANEIMSRDEALLYGGESGESYDLCYHKECDTVDNLNMVAFDTNTDAAAYVTYHFAMEEPGR